MKRNDDILASERNDIEFADSLGNPLKIGDFVLVLVPKTDASFRKAVIRDMKLDYFGRQSAYVEYDDGRLYCNIKHFRMCIANKDAQIKFTSKPIKVWRDNSEIIKFNAKYFD